MKKFVQAIFLLLLFGCGSSKWINYDRSKTSQQYFDKDWADCKLAGLDRFGLGKMGLDNTPPEFWANCMKSKGWREVN